MAFFKFRKGAGESPAATAQTESVEVLRRRARHRLIGAAVLVLLGVIGFPVLFDTQPRPVAVDIPIEIPDRNKVKPLPAPVPAAAADADAGRAPARPAASGPVTAAAPAAPEARPAASAPVATAPQARAEPPPVAAAGKAESAPPKAEPAPAKPVPAPADPVAKAEPAPRPGDDGQRAKALLEGKVPVAAAAAPREGRFIVQVGAFADPAKARETRLKVEKAGLKTYTHVADTKEGKRIRVRVGPFASRAEADKAASRIKELDLPAAILTL